MGRLYCLMGKSSCGKDTIYKMLMADESLALRRVVPYTTRPIRAGEVEGVEYHFTDKPGLDKLTAANKVIECRCYNTVHGDWYYFTVDDEDIDLCNHDYLLIGTLEAYESIRDYYGRDKVVPLFIDLDDGIRLERALNRERSQNEPKYKEMCRRFIADCEDFSEEKIAAAGIESRYINNELEKCFDDIRSDIASMKGV